MNKELPERRRQTVRNLAKGLTGMYKEPTAEVSNRMKRVKSKETGLEKKMEEILGKIPLDYEKQPAIFGHPDFKIKGTRILIFSDSTFWHGRRKEDVTGLSFKKNREFWTNKISRTRIRDKRTNEKLRKEGWTVLRFWDDDIKDRPNIIAEKIKGAMVQ